MNFFSCTKNGVMFLGAKFSRWGFNQKVHISSFWLLFGAESIYKSLHLCTVHLFLLLVKFQGHFLLRVGCVYIMLGNLPTQGMLCFLHSNIFNSTPCIVYWNCIAYLPVCVYLKQGYICHLKDLIVCFAVCVVEGCFFFF